MKINKKLVYLAQKDEKKIIRNTYLRNKYDSKESKNIITLCSYRCTL